MKELMKTWVSVFLFFCYAIYRFAWYFWPAIIAGCALLFAYCHEVSDYLLVGAALLTALLTLVCFFSIFVYQDE